MGGSAWAGGQPPALLLARPHTCACAGTLPTPHPPTRALPRPHPRPPLTQALTAYHEDVVGGRFPSEAYSPYRIPAAEAERLLEDLRREGLGRAAEAVAQAAAGEPK